MPPLAQAPSSVLPFGRSTTASIEVPPVDFDLALQQQLSERQRRKDARTGVERIFSRKQIEQAFIESFEMVGGIPRLAIWANKEENYGQFLNLLMRLAPKDMGGAIQGAVLEYRSNVPQSPLNRQKPEVQEEEIEDAEIVDATGAIEHDSGA